MSMQKWRLVRFYFSLKISFLVEVSNLDDDEVGPLPAAALPDYEPLLDDPIDGENLELFMDTDEYRQLWSMLEDQ